MLLSTIRHQMPKLFTTATSFVTTKTPPRKARQSVRRILHLLSSQPLNPALSEALQILKNYPSSLSLSQASTLISTLSNPIISFYFYQYLKSSHHLFKPNSTLFTALITSQLQSINPHLPKIQYYFKEMKKYDVCLSHDDFRGFFKLLVPNYIEIAEFLIRDVLDKMEFEEGIYNFVISVYWENGFCKEAILMAERVRARCSNPSLGFYCCVMDLYKNNGDAVAAMKLFLEMEERGVVANEKIYGVLLEIFCGVGWFKLCWVIVEEMVKVGFRIDECLGVKMLRRFVKEGMLSESENLFREGFVKDKESLGVLMEAMAEKGKPWVGLQLVKSMQNSGLDVDGDVYALLIRGCGKFGLIGDAEKIFSEIKSSSMVMNMEAVYSSMIFVYSKVKMKNKAEIVWAEMKAMDSIRCSEGAFICLMLLYGSMGLVEDVLQLFDEWKRSSCHVSIDAYAVLVDALSKSGRLNQASDFLLKMRQEGFYPTNSIYSSMLEGYLQVGLVNHALALVDEHKKSGLEVDEVVATSVVKTFIQMGRFKELEFYLDKLAKQGIKIPRDKGAHLVEMCRDDYFLGKISCLIE